MPIGRRELWIYLAGLLAAAQMGKMPPLMPVISRDLGLTLVGGAVVISLIEIGGALFGALAAGVAARAGEWRVLPIGVMLLIGGGIGEALAGNGAGLTAARAIESAGYLSVIVSAPVLMAREATRLTPNLALVVWSTFLPVGLAVGTILSGTLVEPFGWRTVLVFWSFAGIALVLCKPRVATADKASATDRLVRPSGTALVLAIGFGSFTCFQVGMLALMPEFLISEKGATPWSAGLVTGLGGLVTISGVAVPFYLARRSAVRLSLPMLSLSLLVPAALLFGVFSPAASLGASAIIFIGLNVLSGIFPSLVFACIPRWAGPGGIGPANGAVAQAGAVGSLVGPPAYAAVVSGLGWMPAAGFGLGVSLLAVMLLSALESRQRQTRTGGT